MIDANPPKFTWGQTVRVKSNTYLPDRGGELGEVCDVVTVQTSEHAQSVFGGSIGEIAYLVEFGDGLSFEMVGDLLEPGEVRP